jgi:hypothetical protein
VQVTCSVSLKVVVVATRKPRKPKVAVAKANVVATKKVEPRTLKAVAAAIRKLKAPVVATRKLKPRTLKVLAVAIRKPKDPVAAIRKPKLKKTPKANVAKANAVERKKVKIPVFV